MDKKEAKNAFLKAKEFAEVSSAPLFTYEEGGLEKLEPEKKHSSWGTRLKMILKLVVYVVIFIKIVLESFKKLGDEKIQVLSTEMHNEYFYQMADYPLKKLMPLHWFVEMNREDVVDRMECTINQN